MAKKTRNDRLAALRDRMQSVDSGGAGGFFTPKQGANVLRILPEVGDMEFFFQVVGRHYLPNKKNFYCPAFTSEGELPCPICEVVNDLYKSGDKASKALAGDIRVRKQYWMNVIDRENENAGPLVYTPGITVFGAIKSLVLDPDYGDIMDIDNGIDITIVRSGEGLDTSYQVNPRRMDSPLNADKAIVEDWLDKARDLSWVELTDDPEQDKEIAEGHAVWVLPYDRIVEEAGLDDGFEEAVAEPEEEEEEEESDVKAEITKRRAARGKSTASATSGSSRRRRK